MQTNPTYSKPQQFANRFLISYVLLFISSFSFPHAILPDIGKWFSPFYEKLAAFTGSHIFHLSKPYSAELISDSTGMYLHAFNLIFISAVIAIAWFYSDRQKKNEMQLVYGLQLIIRYYLALQLLNYGFNKIFKWQFYLPEPNTLFTSVGETHRDLLYWTSMGSSYTYTFFSGLIEVLAASLLLFRRTKLFGALIAIGIMVNVLMINIGFDISVKLYSAFLILLCCILIAPDAKRLFRFFFTNEAIAKNNYVPSFVNGKFKTLYRSLKTLVLLLFFSDTLFIYFASGNFNDDKAVRPPLHGAYEVSVFVLDGDTLAPLQTDQLRWKRVFVHRRNYFIVQNMQDGMQDYILENDTAKQILLLTDYDGKQKGFFHYDKLSGDANTFSGRIGMHKLEMELKKIDLKNLPLLQDEFGWTVDE